VLPFANIAGDPEQEYFADGLTEDIVTDLCRYLRCLSPATACRPGGGSDMRKLAHDLNVTSVKARCGRKALRASMRAVDGATGDHLGLTDTTERRRHLALQDEISRASSTRCA
jgi:adenylate cyclase